jgi:hypothetical protein
MRDDPRSVPTIDELVAWLDLLAAQDSRCGVAAGFLRGNPPGRPTINDNAALAQIDWLLERGDSPSVENAAKRVAATMGSFHSVSSTAARLARKYRNKCSDKII